MIVKKKIAKKLNALNVNFLENTGKKVKYFFCPILFVDEETEVCEAHIVNKAFSKSSRSWTIQRKDVDGFYGRLFESDFVKLDYAISNKSIYEVMTDESLMKKYRPMIINKKNERIEYFYPTGKVPEQYSEIQLSLEEQSLNLGLKIHPETSCDYLEFEVALDLRLCALVSLIKAGYLTLFEMLGYNYSLSLSGKLIGSSLLGEFYKKNVVHEKNKEKVIANAKCFFEEYVNLVKPIEKADSEFKGTAKDKQLFLCEKNDIYWACIVLIKTSDRLHAVLMPLYDTPLGEQLFRSFILKCGEITAKLVVYKNNTWGIKSTHNIYWSPNNANEQQGSVFG